MVEALYRHRQRWQQQKYSQQPDPIHVLPVLTDEEIEGVCTVGDARYTSMRTRNLEYLRALTLSEDPLQKERLDSKLRVATRHIFTLQGWHGVFDNFLWDISGKAAQLLIYDLVGRALQDLRFESFEQPLPNRNFEQLQALCSMLYILILAPETLMHEWKLSGLWLRQGATDLLHANSRHGTTATLKLAHCAQMKDSTIELNDPEGLFKLIHVHVACAISNTSCYEYFPGGTRDDLGREIGLMNPSLSINGYVRPPQDPRWDAKWDRTYFEKSTSSSYEPNVFFSATYTFRQRLLIYSALVYSYEHT